MTSVSSQRDLVNILKKECVANVWILSKVQPISSDLSKLLKENQLEKPTQNLFNHLSYYLVSIIDPRVTLPWPLYDTKTERTYRNELSAFITDYSNKGLLSPVISSYFVNPGCYKVVYLMFQLSKLAVHRAVLARMKKESQKTLYSDMTQQYKSKDVNFIENIEKETKVMSSKLTNHLEKKSTLEHVAEKLRNYITQKEESMRAVKAQEMINKLVDGYIQTQDLDEETKAEILEIKNVKKPAKYFDKWLEKLDSEITDMESQWESNTAPFLTLCQTTCKNTETLIARQTGEVDKRTFMIEYNPKIDKICTDELEKQVNTQQKYILKNIVRDNRLNFPNLIRGYLVSICFIFKSVEVGDEIYQFNEYLEQGTRNYGEVVQAMRTLLERVTRAEGRLQGQQETFTSSIPARELSEIPPLPDLSDLKINRDCHPPMLCNPFTPLNLKHQFNLRKQKSAALVNPLPKIFVTPYQHGLKEDFFKSLSSRISVHDNMNTTQNNFNISVMSHARGNETIGECTTGFTKQQISRLLSTKKSSIKKKFKHKIERPDMKIKRGGLFNESMFSNESICILRSHSSPNLYESREKRSRSRRLSIMKEDSPSLLEVSGIAAIERDSNHSTPQGMLESTRKLIDSASLPSISLIGTPKSDMSDNIEVDSNKEFKAPLMLPQRRSREASEDKPVLPLRKSKLPQPTNKKVVSNQYLTVPETNSRGLPVEQILSPQRKNQEVFEKEILLLQKSQEIFEENSVLPQRKSTELNEAKPETPKMNPPIVKKTSSLEKIINRFKKVRASILPPEPSHDNNEIKTIVEEKENLNSVNVDAFTANRNLLPDLLSPSCNVAPKYNNDILVALNFDSDDDDDNKVSKPRRPRESLGALLGVDHTFLDQFDLSD